VVDAEKQVSIRSRRLQQFSHTPDVTAIRKEFVASLKKYLDYLETTLQ
jgi:hypothetical protein